MNALVGQEAKVNCSLFRLLCGKGANDGVGIRAQKLTGVAGADQTYFRRSAKRIRHGLWRKARRRGGKPSGRRRSHELVAVLAARDRAGQSADFIVEVDDSEHAADKLKPLLAKDTIVCTEGDATARKRGVEHHAVNVSAGMRVDGPWLDKTSTPTTAA